MDAQGRQVREGWLERQGQGFLQRSQSGQTGAKGSATRGRLKARLFLRPHEWDEKEIDIRKNSERPEL
jgi:hypothetical protein